MTLGAAATAVTTQVRVERPYKGLDPYSDSDVDALLFFGREAERKIVSSNLIGSRLTVLYGPSGVGKSSLLQAGVAHHLRQRAAEEAGENGIPEYAVVVFRTWTRDPVRGLLDAVDAAVDAALAGNPEPDIEAHELPQPGTMTAELEAASRRLGGDLLIILDQFEEYFLYHGDEEGEGTFAIELPRAVNDLELHANFLISIREDALAKLDRFKGRIQGLFDNYLRLEHLGRESARLAIVEPLDRYSRATPDDPVGIEPALVDEVLDQVRIGRVAFGSGGRGGIDVGPGSGSVDDRIETLYLQMVMSRLWQEERTRGSSLLRLATLHDLGGAVDIVRAHLADALAELPPSEQEVAARAFTYLVTPAGAKIALSVPELAEGTRLGEEELEPVLERLKELRVLGIEQSTEPRYEIAHDALAKVILEWRTGFEEERERAEHARRALEAREAARRRRRIRALTIVLVLIVLASTAAVVLAFEERANARSRERREHSRGLATSAALDLQTDPLLGLLQAIRAVRVARTIEADTTLRFALSQYRLRAVLHDPREPITAAAFSADGERVVTGGTGGTARIWDVPRGRTNATLRGHPGRIDAVAFSPNGKLVVTAGDDGIARIWSTGGSRRLVAALPEGPRPVVGVAFGADGRSVVTVTDDLGTQVWDLRGTLVRTVVRAGTFSPVRSDGAVLVTSGVASARSAGVPRPAARAVRAAFGDSENGAAFSSDGRLVAVTRANGADVWRLGDGGVITLRGHAKPVNGVAFSPDGSLVVTASDDETARVWETDTGRTVAVLRGHTERVNGAAFSPDGRYVVTASADLTAGVWDVASGRSIGVLRGHEKPVERAAFSADGRSILTVADDGSARIWSTPTVAADARFRGRAPSTPVKEVAFTRDGRHVATASEAGTVELWDVRTHRRLRSVHGAAAVSGSIVSPNGNRLVTGRFDGSVVVSPVGGGRPLILRGHAAPVTKVAFSPDGRLLATASTDTTARVWDLATGRPRTRPLRHAGPVVDVAFSGDGDRIVTASSDGTARLWTASGKLVATLEGHTGPVDAAVFSPDGRLVATGSDDDTVRLWDAASGRLEATLRGHMAPVGSLAFAPDGDLLVSASDDGTARVWDAHDGHPVAVLVGHSQAVRRVGFSPSGELVVTASDDGTARVWEVGGGRSVALLSGYRGAVAAAAFSPDGRRIVTAGDDGAARLYACDVCEPIDALVRDAQTAAMRDPAAREKQRFVRP